MYLFSGDAGVLPGYQMCAYTLDCKRSCLRVFKFKPQTLTCAAAEMYPSSLK